MSQPYSALDSGDLRRVGAAISGDRAAAGEILERLLPKVRNLSRYLVSSDAEVDDVVQVACVEILKSLPTWRAEASLESWALRIAARVARRHAGGVWREQQSRRAAAPELRAVQEAPDKPDRYLERRDIARRLDQLPTLHRQALVLHHVLGMSVPELASELEVPFETARSRLRLARKKFRTLCVQGGPDGS